MLKSIFKFLIFGFIFSLSYLNTFAQTFELIIHSKDSSNIKIIKKLNYNPIHKSAKEAIEEVGDFSKKLTKLGYINNSYTLSKNNTTVKATFKIYKKIELIRIYFSKNAIDKTFIKQLALNSTPHYFEIPLSKVEQTLTNIVSYFENKGYSFTNISLENLQQEKSLLTAKLIIDISTKRTIDNVIFKGYSEFPKKYTQHYLDIKFGEPFNLEFLNNLNQAINKLPFVTQIKKPEVLFTKDSTTLYIYVKKKQTSNFDGIIGFSNEENTGKVRFNGYLDLNLNNILNKGESFHINWESSQQQNSSLNLAFSSPYIFNSNINLHGSFNIFKQDSLYINTKGIVKLGYNINQNNTLNIIGASEKSDLSSSTTIDSNFSNFKKNTIGLSYNFKILESSTYLNENRLNVEASYFTGNRNNELEKEQQNNIEFLIEYMLHFNTRSSISIKNTGKILNATNIYENELYRIGGINSIRGFNESSIFTSKYNLTNLEYQYGVNYNSYLYTITDFALINDLNTNTTTQLYGLGLGYYIKTNQIVLNLSYALGKNYNSPLNLNNSKVHIKLTYPF